MFDGSFDNYSDFIAKHQKSKEWTDNAGIMVAATALYLGKKMWNLLFLNVYKICTYLGRRIRIYGTNHIGTHRPFFEEYGGPGSEDRDPLMIGHYTDQHYISISRRSTVLPPSSPIPPPAPTFPTCSPSATSLAPPPALRSSTPIGSSTMSPSEPTGT